MHIKFDTSERLNSPQVIAMMSPAGFYPNPETMETNKFQASGHNSDNGGREQLIQLAKTQHENLIKLANRNGVQVVNFQGQGLPDEVYLNNWFSTHKNEVGESVLVLYPLMAENRRNEKRKDLIKFLKQASNKFIDLSFYEQEGKYLESTGSLVLDRVNKIVYASESERCDKDLVSEWSKQLGYHPIIFNSFDEQGVPIYHTNVMMWVGTSIAGVCLESIKDSKQRALVKDSLEKSSKEVINLSQKQVLNFLGNAYELSNSQGKKFLFMSNAAYNSLEAKQKAKLLNHYGQGGIIHVPYSAIHQGGGSVRCSIAALYGNFSHTT